MFKLKKEDLWDLKRKETIERLIIKGEEYKDKSVEKWKKKIQEYIEKK
ncbi:MAG: hypothetical protein ACTSVV_09085 [Promethearchaeota archaeon]